MKQNNLKTGWSGRLTFLVFALLTCACEDFVKVDVPKTQIVSTTVFTDDGTAKSAMAGLYSKMVDSELLFTSGIQSITVFTGLSSDELTNYSGSAVNVEYFTNTLSGNSSLGLWSGLYKTIYDANAILDGLENSEGVTPATRVQLSGEAKFIRAFCHFYLTNLFGDVPIALTTDYKINNVLSRASTSEVYVQIIADLQEAQSVLPIDFAASNDERVRPNKWAATALLARTYLYTEAWTEAETQASLLINNPMFELKEDLNETFLANSAEAIWQLMPNLPGYNTFDGATFILNSAPTVVALNNSLMSEFETGDLRQSEWVGSLTTDGTSYFFPYKYKVQTGFELSEYLTVFRLSEQYLIRAEARANRDNFGAALEDINAVRTRAGLADISTDDRAALLNLIEHERRVELFSEWGHRWFDLLRTDRATSVLGPIKLEWQPADMLYPVPLSELKSNANLLPQNPGY